MSPGDEKKFTQKKKKNFESNTSKNPQKPFSCMLKL